MLWQEQRITQVNKTKNGKFRTYLDVGANTEDNPPWCPKDI